MNIGHNRSLQEVVATELEDVHGVAVQSYQGGHVEHSEWLVESLLAQVRDITVYDGDRGVILPEEIARLREIGVTTFSPEDGQRLPDARL